ncbi:MAG: hypothetical protein PHX13_10400 [Thiovulaceae bacterium]|nr:hypothetical protein [Sulfurimonadaceae bacterium]
MSMTSSANIKNTQVLISKIETELQYLASQMHLVQENISVKNKQLQSYKEQLMKLQTSSKELIVSEHATLRYLERVYKLDLEKLHREIVPASLKKQISSLGNGTYTSEGFRIRVVDNMVVTVLESEEIYSHKKSPLKKRGKKQIVKKASEAIKEELAHV